MQIRFSKHDPELEIYYPDGRRFLTTVELNQQAIQAEERAIEAEERAIEVTQERDQVTQERDQVAQERDRLLAQLRALGINPE